jgi:hypothetical protein
MNHHSQIEWIYTSESDPAHETSRMGKSTSVIVFACDEDGEIYMARHICERNGTDYWVEESLNGLRTVIPNVVMWAYKPNMEKML